MYVSCLFKKSDLGGYAGKAYTFRTSLPLKVGDKVILPSARGNQCGMVVEVGLDAPAFEAKEITEYDSEVSGHGEA